PLADAGGVGAEELVVLALDVLALDLLHVPEALLDDGHVPGGLRDGADVARVAEADLLEGDVAGHALLLLLAEVFVGLAEGAEAVVLLVDPHRGQALALLAVELAEAVDGGLQVGAGLARVV